MKKDRKWGSAAAAFLLPVIVYLIMLAVERFAPFGAKTLLITDLSDQYVPFYNGLKSGDVWFSWSKSLGTNYLGLFAYYISSPFSLITLLIPNRYMYYGVLVMTALKLGCAGLTSRRYFSECFSLTDAAGLLFSTAYSLSAYCLVYALCVMWLDGVLWLPLILLGTERILRGESPWLFRVSLFVCLISSYYISYMIVIFTCLYFVVRCAEDRRDLLRRLPAFALSGLLAAGVAAVFLVPTFLSHFEGKLVTEQNDYAGFLNFDLPELVQKLVFGGFDSITNKGGPNVYCGLITVWFALSFFAREKIPARSRLCWGALLFVMLLSLWLSPLDRVWHVFKYPNWFPYRYSFLVSFVVICLAARSFSAGGFDLKRGLVIALTLVMAADLGWNGIRVLRGLDDSFRYENAGHYVDFVSQKEDLLGAFDGGETFYRVRSDVDRSKNDAISFDYNGTTHYSSAYLASVNAWVHSIGMAQGWIWCADYGSTPVTDLFLDIQYAVSDTQPGPFYEILAENGLGGAYASSVVGSLGYFVPNDRASWESADDPFDGQTRLFEMLTGVADVYVTPAYTAYQQGDEAAAVLVSDGEPLFCWLPKQNASASLYVNDGYVTGLFSGETDCIHYLGTFPAGQEVRVSVQGAGVVPELRCLDTDAFYRGLAAINGLDLAKVKDTGGVTASIECGTDGFVVTSIPDGGGWRVWVDGERVQTQTACDTFLAFPIGQGAHTVRLAYAPPGTAAGAVVTTLSVLALAAEFALKRRRKTAAGPGGETPADGPELCKEAAKGIKPTKVI